MPTESTSKHFVIKQGANYFRQFTWCDREPLFADSFDKAYKFPTYAGAAIVAEGFPNLTLTIEEV